MLGQDVASDVTALSSAEVVPEESSQFGLTYAAIALGFAGGGLLQLMTRQLEHKIAIRTGFNEGLVAAAGLLVATCMVAMFSETVALAAFGGFVASRAGGLPNLFANSQAGPPEKIVKEMSCV